MPKFMLLLHRNPEPFQDMSPEEIQHVIGRYQAWAEKIRASGHYVVSDKLQEEGGKVVTLRQGRVSVTDGPYSEAKEVIGGYFTIRAADYNEAVELTRDCPFLDHGAIAIRQTDPMGCGDE